MPILESQYSSQVSAKSEDFLAPAQVTGLSYELLQGEVKLSWSPVSTSALVTESFSGDGSTDVFNLQYPNIADGTYVVTVDGAEMFETTDFTIDQLNGVVTFVNPPAVGTDNVVVEYRQVLDDLSAYRIYRKRPADGSFTLLDTVNSTTAAQVTALTDVTAHDGSTYDYAVSAIDDEVTPNEGIQSAALAVKTIPSVPQGLVPSAFDAMIRLNWNSVKDEAIPEKNENLAGYNIYRSEVDGSGYENIGNVAAEETSFEDSSAVNGTTYYYVITAYDNSL